MQKNVSKEIGDLVKKVLSDYDGGKNIDATDIFNKPDRNEVIDIVDNLFFVMYPGYFKDITYKFYNPKNGIAIMLEDIIYRLNKQVALAIDFKGLMTEEKRKEERRREKKRKDSKETCQPSTPVVDSLPFFFFSLSLGNFEFCEPSVKK